MSPAGVVCKLHARRAVPASTRQLSRLSSNPVDFFINCSIHSQLLAMLVRLLAVLVLLAAL